ncbi:magnesium transporter [Eubacterium saphenum ATCC 49989]|nr:magnesium transporter [Eubacterium saphenum ATCC 49989]
MEDILTHEGEADERREKFQAFIDERNFREAKNFLSTLNVVDIANLIDGLDPQTGVALYRMLPKDVAAEVFAKFDPEQQEAIIYASTDTEIRELIEDMFLDDTVDLLEEMPSGVVSRILENTGHSDRSMINQLLKYPDSSAGSIMTTEYISLKKEMTVSSAIDKIKREGIQSETIYILYVTDENRILEGILSLRDLIVADDSKRVGELMREDVIYAYTLDDKEEVANIFKKYSFEALPIVDQEKRIVGIVTVDDILDVIEEEVTEDFQIMAATTPTDKPYLETGIFALSKHRILWLLILMISATITQKIIYNYENILQNVTFLSGFIPMLMDTGGNSGSQSSTLIIRGLATGDIKSRDWYRVVFKEVRVAMVCGLALAVINYFKIIYLDGIPSNVALVVSLTLVCAVMIAKIVGAILPMVAIKIKVDPAIMASPLITTIADALSLMVYFIIARNIMSI